MKNGLNAALHDDGLPRLETWQWLPVDEYTDNPTESSSTLPVIMRAPTDRARAMHLAELTMEFALEHLKPGGSFLLNVFQGAGFEGFCRLMRRSFPKPLATFSAAMYNGSAWQPQCCRLRSYLEQYV